MAIYVRITVLGKRTEFATGRKVDPKKWNSRSGRASGEDEACRTLNNNLIHVEQQVQDAYFQLVKFQDEVSAESVRDKVLGKREKVERMLLETFAEHNSRVKALVGSEYSAATLQRYETTLKHVRDMIRSTYHKVDVKVGKVDFVFINDLEFYLRTERNCANNSAVKYIKNFKKIIRICLASGWISTDPFLNYKAKLKPVERSFLSSEELGRIKDKKMTARLDAVRDVFLFRCYTGLAYVDVQKLTRQEIALGNDGEMWIRTTRKKTDTPTNVPILPVAMQLVRKYNATPSVRPTARCSRFRATKK